MESQKKKKKGKVFQEKNKMIHRRLGSRREGLVPLSPVDRVARGSLSTHGEGSVHASHRPTGSPASLTEQLQPTSLKGERETSKNLLRQRLDGTVWQPPRSSSCLHSCSSAALIASPGPSDARRQVDECARKKVCALR